MFWEKRQSNLSFTFVYPSFKQMVEITVPTGLLSFLRHTYFLIKHGTDSIRGQSFLSFHWVRYVCIEGERERERIIGNDWQISIISKMSFYYSSKIQKHSNW